MREPFDLQSLSAAVRAIDILAEETGGAESALKTLGAEPNAAATVAEQRALRVYALLTGQMSEPINDSLVVSVHDPQLLAGLTTLFLDGLACGLSLRPES